MERWWLLLVHAARDVLVVCGSVFRGICSLRNLSNVEQLLYFSDTKGEKSYVASAEESVSVVGVMSYFTTREKANFTVFLVGKGYGSHDSTKLISTRILQDYGDWVVFDSIIEASAVQANPFVLRYLHDFRFAFKDGGFVYFLFSRTLGVQDTKNFTFVSRMCEDDQGYYSYTELQLNCSAANKYNKAQPENTFYAAYVATPGEVLAQSMTSSGQYGRVSASDKVLFVTFTSDEDPSTSAMCMFPLRSINSRLVEIIGACYSHHGIISEKAAVYSPYSSKEELCSEKPRDMAHRYRCGAEFLPSPLASKAEFALTVEPSLVRKAHMTAVAVAEVEGHAVAFLGTATGEVTQLPVAGKSVFMLRFCSFAVKCLNAAVNRRISFIKDQLLDLILNYWLFTRSFPISLCSTINYLTFFPRVYSVMCITLHVQLHMITDMRFMLEVFIYLSFVCFYTQKEP
uniref:Plexin-B2-like n=1 Tax=Stegastes partitus TaxID=144197 RepID=A0A3B4ZH80_9TELE